MEASCWQCCIRFGGPGFELETSRTRVTRVTLDYWYWDGLLWRYFAKGWESLDAYVRTFWCKKLRIFWNLWCFRTDKWAKPGWTFCRLGGQFFVDRQIKEEVNFLRFCAAVPYAVSNLFVPVLCDGHGMWIL